jgi:RTX calcium-binding nonapeptide repeat (4 copies)
MIETKLSKQSYQNKAIQIIQIKHIVQKKIMTTTISAPINSTTGVSITAPVTASTVTAFLTANPSLAISLSTGATGRNLTALGVFPSSTDTAWRLRNGTTNSVSPARFFATGGGFDNQYFLPANTDTFVLSTINGTHRLEFPGFGSTKARGTQTVSSIAPLPANASYSLRGAGGNDTLTGGAGNDTLTGFGGSDTFVFTNQGIDAITDFTAGAGGDIFGIRSSSYTGAPTAPSDANTDTANSIADASNSIIVDTLASITGLGATKSNIRFAFADDNILLYDADGDWSSGSVTIATTDSISGLVSGNFAFVV